MGRPRSRGAGAALAACLAVAALAPGPARADDPTISRAVIDQVVLEPSSLTGQRLTVELSMLTLQGQTIPLPEPGSIHLMIDNHRSDAPFAIGRYGERDADTAIAVVVQTSLEFTDVLPVIADALDQNVLATLPDHTRVAILPYGEAQGGGKLTSVKAARRRVTGITSDGSVAEPSLLDTVERALRLVERADTKPEGRPLRKMVIVIGDGRDATPDRDRVTKLGVRADKHGVRIHAFGFSPSDTRRPLLLLGELSKRSHGTFRWVRGARSDSWTPAFQQLATEIEGQHVLTYFLPAGEDLSGRKVRIELVGRAPLVSNDHKLKSAGCNDVACDPGAYCAVDRCVMPRADDGRGVLGWSLIVLGIIVGLLVVLGVIGWLITRRQQRAAAAPGPGVVPGAVPGVAPGVAPGVVPGSVPAPAVAPAAPAAAATGPRFYVMTGPLAGREVPVRHGMWIGKAPGCDLLIDDGYASSQHAQVGVDHFGNCRLYDHGSTNGTFVNGVRVTQHSLEHGNLIRIGSTELRFLAQ